MTVNWNDLLNIAGESGLTLVDPGEYDAIIDKTEAAKSQNNKEMIRVWFRITTGPLAGRGGIRSQFTLSPENSVAVGIFFRDMNALGFSEDYFKSQPPPKIEKLAQDMVGRQCRIRIAHGEWNGDPRHEVKKILAPKPGTNGAAPQPPTFPGATPGFTPPTPPLPPSTPRAGTPTPFDDDPPF